METVYFRMSCGAVNLRPVTTLPVSPALFADAEIKLPTREAAVRGQLGHHGFEVASLAMNNRPDRLGGTCWFWAQIDWSQQTDQMGNSCVAVSAQQGK